MLRLSLSQEVGEEGEEGEEGADMNMHGEDRSRDEGRTRESRPEAAGGGDGTRAPQPQQQEEQRRLSLTSPLVRRPSICLSSQTALSCPHLIASCSSSLE